MCRIFNFNTVDVLFNFHTTLNVINVLVQAATVTSGAPLHSCDAAAEGDAQDLAPSSGGQPNQGILREMARWQGAFAALTKTQPYPPGRSSCAGSKGTGDRRMETHK
jgi:hypothetical protein